MIHAYVRYMQSILGIKVLHTHESRESAWHSHYDTKVTSNFINAFILGARAHAHVWCGIIISISITGSFVIFKWTEIANCPDPRIAFLHTLALFYDPFEITVCVRVRTYATHTHARVNAREYRFSTDLYVWKNSVISIPQVNEAVLEQFRCIARMRIVRCFHFGTLIGAARARSIFVCAADSGK